MSSGEKWRQYSLYLGSEFTIAINEGCATERLAQGVSSNTFPIIPKASIESFQSDGFVVIPNVLTLEVVRLLNDRLEQILRGEYDRGHPPDKAPKKIKLSSQHPEPLGFNGNHCNVKVLQVINANKCDSLFRELACSAIFGALVSQLMGWKTGARLLQDQMWAKPPSSSALVFHTDSPYFPIDPVDEAATIWVALDNMDDDLGPLQYVRGSHRWPKNEDRRLAGSNSHFFEENSRRLWQAGVHAGAIDANDKTTDSLDFVALSGLPAGSISIHDGRTWHGSGKNLSRTQPRRGLGIHLVPGCAKLTEQALKSKLFKHQFCMGNPLNDDAFPVLWRPNDHS